VRALPDNRLIHAKLIIIDTSVAVIGSHNLSVKSCCNNFEVSLMVANGATVAGLQGVYNDIFEKAVKV
jgi:phosphatidylserine/phosphatidylglycerophosphate/cardiolipin synthase-like enzyme